MAEAAQRNENSLPRTPITVAVATNVGTSAEDAVSASEAAGSAADLLAAPGDPATAQPESGPQNPTPSALSERDRKVLALERQWWKYAGAKEQAIRDIFDLSATHYYQILNALIDTQDALAHDPMLVKRLRRLRTSRQRARTARRLGN